MTTNKIKEKKVEAPEPAPEPVAVQEEVVRIPKRKNKFLTGVGDVFTGSFLAKESYVQQLPFLFFLVFMALCYISNGYYAEQKIREINNITSELKELKSQYIISKSELMFISKQSEVAKAAEPLGIKESVVPPKKITVLTMLPPQPQD